MEEVRVDEWFKHRTITQETVVHVLCKTKVEFS